MSDDKVQEKLQELVDSLDVSPNSARGVVNKRDGDEHSIYSVIYSDDRGSLRSACKLFKALSDSGVAYGGIPEAYKGKDGAKVLEREMYPPVLKTVGAPSHDGNLKMAVNMCNNISICRSGDGVFKLRFVNDELAYPEEVILGRLEKAIKTVKEDNARPVSPAINFAETGKNVAIKMVKKYLEAKVKNILPDSKCLVESNKSGSNTSSEFVIKLYNPEKSNGNNDKLYRNLREVFGDDSVEKIIESSDSLNVSIISITGNPIKLADNIRKKDRENLPQPEHTL